VTAVGDVAEQNLRELGHITLRFDGQPQAEFPEPFTWRARCRRPSPRLRTEICCLIKEKMNQVAVVIGGGQTLGSSCAAGLPQRATAWRWSIFRVKKPRVAHTINAEYGEGMAYGFGADATSEPA
jgi:hypothetical protein